MCVCVCVCVCVCGKGKTEERYIFDGLFIFQCVSTVIFFSECKNIYQNYSRMRNNYDIQS